VDDRRIDVCRPEDREEAERRLRADAIVRSGEHDVAVLGWAEEQNG
jgi:hypothetical protein